MGVVDFSFLALVISWNIAFIPTVEIAYQQNLWRYPWCSTSILNVADTLPLWWDSRVFISTSFTTLAILFAHFFSMLPPVDFGKPWSYVIFYMKHLQSLVFPYKWGEGCHVPYICQWYIHDPIYFVCLFVYFFLCTEILPSLFHLIRGWILTSNLKAALICC